MTDNTLLKDIQGQQVDAAQMRNLFKGLETDQILLEYDFPRVLSAVAPNGEYWLFKWCNSEEKNEANDEALDLWLAFQISKSRLESVKQGTTSLREAISLAKGNLYLYTCEEPRSPLQAKITEYERVPKEYLPRNDVSLRNGRIMEIAGREPQQLGIRLHMLVEGYTPMSYVKLSDYLQQFISFAAHKVAQDTPLASYEPEDWSVLNVTRASSGSYDLECTSRNPEKSRFLADACDLLETMVSGQKSIETIQGEMGNDAFMHAFNLARFISGFDLSVSLRWMTDEKPNGYLALDKRRADRILEAIELSEKKVTERTILDEKQLPPTQSRRVIIEMNEEKPQPLRSVTLELTTEEADLVRKTVIGEGGMQNLLRELQEKLKADNTITLTPVEIERILKYTFRYGQGGFQERLRGMARALKRVGIGLNEI